MGYQSVFKSDLYQGKVMVVTGGGSGIGRCTAHELAALGAKVVLIGRNETKLSSVQNEIREDGGEAVYFVCDIRDEEAVKNTVKNILLQTDVIDGLVNNAGGQYPAPMSTITQKGFETVVRTNLVGGFLFAREVYTQCMQKRGGAIVNIIADMWGGMPGMAHSGAARAGMDNLTKTAGYEWACSGVRVNAVAPGWIASSGLDTYEGPVKAILPKLKDAVPLKRMGTEAEISSAICFLLSDAAAFITGATLRIDGAASLGNPLWPMQPAKNVKTFNGFHRAVMPKILQQE